MNPKPKPQNPTPHTAIPNPQPSTPSLVQTISVLSSEIRRLGSLTAIRGQEQEREVLAAASANEGMTGAARDPVTGELLEVRSVLFLNPGTLNLEPQTPNPKPQTPNPKPQTPNPKL